MHNVSDEDDLVSRMALAEEIEARVGAPGQVARHRVQVASA